MNYWDLIKDAFWITLRNRYLWFFGFFAGVGGTSDFNSNFPMGGAGPDNDFDQGQAHLNRPPNVAWASLSRGTR